ncbi:MAG: hypothetical protein PHX48_08500 [Bacteroidales bacterium]|nr:hypothetical protein [Bacteroidales bacterium]
MKINIINAKTCLIVLLFSSLSLISCQSSKSVINQVFNEQEANTINKIIDFYDAYVLSFYKDSIPIDKAYKKFVYFSTPIAENTGDLLLFLPPESSLVPFINSLDKNSLTELYFISDSVKVFDTVIKVPYNFTLNYRGKFLQKYLKKLSRRNEILNIYYRDFIAAGDVSPTALVMLMHDYEKFNFNNRDERFAFISAFFFRRHMTETEEYLYKNMYKRQPKNED